MKNDTETENILRQQHLLSNGRLLSSFSHELSNQMAVIQESAGLLQDYIEMGRIDDETLCTKLEQILLRVDQRVDIVGSMTIMLNRFSHRFDSENANVDLCEILEEQLFFLERFARLKKIEVINQTLQKPVSANSSPGLLQFLIYYLHQTALSLLHEESQLTIEIVEKNSIALLHIFFTGCLQKDENNPFLKVPAEVKLCLEKVKGQLHLSFSEQDTITAVTLEIPLG